MFVLTNKLLLPNTLFLIVDFRVDHPQIFKSKLVEIVLLLGLIRKLMCFILLTLLVAINFILIWKLLHFRFIEHHDWGLFVDRSIIRFFRSSLSGQLPYISDWCRWLIFIFSRWFENSWGLGLRDLSRFLGFTSSWSLFLGLSWRLLLRRWVIP